MDVKSKWLLHAVEHIADIWNTSVQKLQSPLSLSSMCHINCNTVAIYCDDSSRYVVQLEQKSCVSFAKYVTF